MRIVNNFDSLPEMIDITILPRSARFLEQNSLEYEKNGALRKSKAVDCTVPLGSPGEIRTLVAGSKAPYA